MRIHAERLLLTFGLWSLWQNGAQGQSTPTVAAASDSAALAVVQAYFASYNAHDIDGVIRFLSADFTWLSLSGDSLAVEQRGASSIRASLVQYFRDFPSARSEIESAVVLGPWVTVRERAHWQSTSGPRSQAAISVYEIRAGVLRRVWYYPAEKG